MSESEVRPMTLTERRRMARFARRCGYWQRGSTVGVNCPCCDQRVEADLVTGHGSKVAQLDAAVVFHLDGYCEAEGQLR